MNNRLETALTYAGRGWRLVPQTRGKKPCLKDWPKLATSDEGQIREWAKKYPKANWAVMTGAESGLVVIDVDAEEKPEEDGRKSWQRLVAEHGEPETLTVATPSGGMHVYYRHPGGTVASKNAGKLAEYPGVEIKADGHRLVTLPGSIYVSGAEYRVLKDSELADLPEWILALTAERPKKTGTAYKVDAQAIHEGQRNAILASYAGSMRRRGMDADAIEAALQAENLKRCHPPLPEAAVSAIARSIGRYEPRPDLLDQDRFHNTDLGNADRFVYVHGANVRHVKEWGTWLLWDGRRWARDRSNVVYDLARGVIRAMYDAGHGIDDDKKRAEYMTYVAGCERRTRLDAMVVLAASDPTVAITPDCLDRHPFLLTVQNGTLDLRTGDLRSHAREDLITKLSPVTFDPSATCPRWDSFVAEIMSGDSELVAFLKTSTGYSLTGDTGEQCFFVPYGLGGNGKTTFLEVLIELAGDYGMHTPTETLMATRGDGIPNDIARLKGARFVAAIEAQEGRRLSESTIKALTGGDTITARFLHAEFFDFRPEFKLWLGVNHRPVIKDTSPAMWRRVQLIPFRYTVPEDKRDKNLKAALLAELPGILNWAMDGALTWQINGSLQSPAAVREATAEYRSEMDTIAAFLEDRCVIEPRASLSAKDLYAAYLDWCSENNEKAASQRTLGLKLKDRGFRNNRRRAGIVWDGLGMRA